MFFPHTNEGPGDPEEEQFSLRHWGRGMEAFPQSSGVSGGHTANFINGEEISGFEGDTMLIRPFFEEVDAILTSQIHQGDKSGICIYGQKGTSG